MLGSSSPFKEYGYPCIPLARNSSLLGATTPSPGTVSGRVQWSPATLATLIFHRLPTLATMARLNPKRMYLTMINSSYHILSPSYYKILLDHLFGV